MGNNFQLHRIIFSHSTVSGILLTVFCLCFVLLTAGCHHSQTNRGHLFRCDWAFEYNRTPWIGCPPDSGCNDDDDGCTSCGGKGCSKCTDKGFRRHCGLTPNCTAKHPCCKSLGCGMWIDPSNPNSFAALNTPKACGLTPFCSPMKPCCLTPFCGKVPAANPQLISMGSMSGTGMNGTSPIQNIQSIQGMSGGQMFNQQGNPILPSPILPNNGNQNNNNPNGTMPKPATLAGPAGALISMGIVPGVSTITSGGLVAAAGVRTPSGMMTPAGVHLPNGTFNNAVVIRACGLNPACNAGHPCGLTPNCGGIVPLAAVSNNAVALASALNAPGIQGGVINAGGGTVPVGGPINGMLVNPISGQPNYGLSMNGIPQVGYPPIGYTPSGYSPKYPRFDGLGIGMSPEQYAQMLGVNSEQEETEEPEPPVESPVTKSQMPVPRFHPVPSKPVFQRSEGMPVKTAANFPFAESAPQKEKISGEVLTEETLKRAYLEGMAAAMEEVENELAVQQEKQEDKQETARIQAEVLQRAEELQRKMAARNAAVNNVAVNNNVMNNNIAKNNIVKNNLVKDDTVNPVSRIPSGTDSETISEIAVETASNSGLQKNASKTKTQAGMLSSAASSAAGYLNGVTGKVRKEITGITSIGSKKNEVLPQEKEQYLKMQQLRNAQQKILQQQTVLKQAELQQIGLKQPPKPLTVSKSAVQKNQLNNDSEIMQAGYAEP